VEEGPTRYEATVAPDGRVKALVEHIAGGVPQSVPPESPGGVSVLAAGRDILLEARWWPRRGPAMGWRPAAHPRAEGDRPDRAMAARQIPAA